MASAWQCIIGLWIEKESFELVVKVSIPPGFNVGLVVVILLYYTALRQQACEQLSYEALTTIAIQLERYPCTS
jgi:hypothetical protein